MAHWSITEHRLQSFYCRLERNALAQAAMVGFRPVRGNSMVMLHTAKQQGGKSCSLILQVSDKNYT